MFNIKKGSMMAVVNNIILKRFGKISAKAEKANSRGNRGKKRFFVMTHGRNNKLTDVGIYDGVTKKYALTDVRAYNAAQVLDEMEAMLRVKV